MSFSYFSYTVPLLNRIERRWPATTHACTPSLLSPPNSHHCPHVQKPEAARNRNLSIMPTKDLIYELLHYFNVRELLPIAAINIFHTKIIRKHLQQRFTLMASRFFPDTKAFLQILSDYDATVSGSAALHLLLPMKTTNWTPNDLDIYAPSVHRVAMCAKMLTLGYFIVANLENEQTPYTSSLIHQVLTFSNTVHNIHVIFSTTHTCHGSTGSPSALSEEDSKGGRDGSRGEQGSSQRY